MLTDCVLTPDWPAPETVKALVTTRLGGASKGGFASLNLGLHVNDAFESVALNRQTLANHIGLDESQFAWLDQVHGQKVVTAAAGGQVVSADGSDTTENNLACVVMTADCLPVLFCDLAGTRVSAIHAGWRGLAGGILQQAVQRFPEPSKVMAWLGPAISQAHFEVGNDVYEAFIANNAENHVAFIACKTPKKWMADIYQLARLQLNSAGIDKIYGGQHCTYAEEKYFYSYRRDGLMSGRMASLIWRDAS
ncbi:MAG: YfiH family protein [Oleiphilaceae bacterium]|jgi:YfiH family protein